LKSKGRFGIVIEKQKITGFIRVDIPAIVKEILKERENAGIGGRG
jgi:hypothetical protein